MTAVPYGCFAPPDIVDRKRNLGKAAAEVGKKQVTDVVIGGNGGLERAACTFQKTDKSFEPMHFKGDPSDAFFCTEHGFFGEFSADGTLTGGNQTEITECDLSALRFTAAKEERKIVHAPGVKFGQARRTTARFFGVCTHKNAFLPEGKLMVPCRQQGVFVAVCEQKSG